MSAVDRAGVDKTKQTPAGGGEWKLVARAHLLLLGRKGPLCDPGVVSAMTSWGRQPGSSISLSDVKRNAQHLSWRSEHPYRPVIKNIILGKVIPCSLTVQNMTCISRLLAVVYFASLC